MKIPDQPAWGSSGVGSILGMGTLLCMSKERELWVVIKRDLGDDKVWEHRRASERVEGGSLFHVTPQTPKYSVN